MKVVIPAAGIGSRLLPSTNECPKCLLKVKGKPILEYQLEALQDNGIRDVILIVGYCKERIIDFLAQEKFDLLNFEVIVNDKYATTHSINSLWLAKKKLCDGFIYLNSDLLFHERLLSELLNHEGDCGIIVDRSPMIPNDDMFKAELQDDKIVLLDKSLPLETADGVAVGPAKFNAGIARQFLALLDTLVRSKRHKWVYSAFSEFSKEYCFHAIDSKGLYWVEIDDPDDLRIAERILTRESTAQNVEERRSEEGSERSRLILASSQV